MWWGKLELVGGNPIGGKPSGGYTPGRPGMHRPGDVNIDGNVGGMDRAAVEEEEEDDDDDAEEDATLVLGSAVSAGFDLLPFSSTADVLPVDDPGRSDRGDLAPSLPDVVVLFVFGGDSFDDSFLTSPSDLHLSVIVSEAVLPFGGGSGRPIVSHVLANKARGLFPASVYNKWGSLMRLSSN